MVKVKDRYIYGKSPNPSNWHEAADVLKSLQAKPKRNPSGMIDRLASIEKQLKDQQ